MTKDDIIRMANEVGIIGPASARQGFKMYANPGRLKRFADLVAAAEREACAKVCDAVQKKNEDDGAFMWEARNCAAAIRARGEQ